MRSAYITHDRVQKTFSGVSRTHQSFKEETDVNNILKKYQRTGLIDHVNKFGGQYADMPDEADFHSAMNLVVDAQDMFGELPATVRARFQNDPAEFLDFIATAENRDELVDAGLIPPLDEPAEGDVIVPANDPEPAPAAA